MAISPHTEVLVDLAANNCVAVLFYRKGATSSTIRPRLIEPYAFVDGKQDQMVRAYQLDHGGDASESGWRFFMMHKIDRVEPTTMRFKPRRKITLPTGEIDETHSSKPDPHWANEARRAYRDWVGDALADGKLTPEELAALKGFRAEHGLTDDDIRFVHASVYHRCLGSVLDDGFVSQEEIDQIHYLHRAMRALGWAVGD